MKRRYYPRARHTYKRNKETSIERAVRGWLLQHHIPYLEQVQVWNFFIDFVVSDIFIEVNGDYWHSLPERQRRDMRLTAYCEKRDVPLIFIWEHEIKRGDFTKLEPLLRYEITAAVL